MGKILLGEHGNLCEYYIPCESDSDLGKWADIVFYAGSCTYMLVIILYSLQRARLESDKESGFGHDYEYVLKAFNSVVITLLFIKVNILLFLCLYFLYLLSFQS